MNAIAHSRARLESKTPRASDLRDTCQHERARAVTIAALLLTACARSGLDLGEGDPSFEGTPPSATATSTSTSLPSSAGAPAVMPPAMPTPSTTPPGTDDPEPPADASTDCVPVSESCNGVDDDCNGQVDDLPAAPCDGGGFRYCVAGAFSSCPRSCEVCVPGSVRICQNSYCLFWGEQECTADGQGFGPCRESRPPSSCSAIAAKHKNSPELERCCLDDGYCCLDQHDLDGDGDRRDMLGACEGVSCP
jgi:hypothetical protein